MLAVKNPPANARNVRDAGSIQPTSLGNESKMADRRTCTHPLLRELQNYNLLLNNHQQEDGGSHQKKTPPVQGQRRSPSKTVGGVKLCLESKPIPARDAQRTQTKPYKHQETPQRLRQTCLWVFECLLRRYGSTVPCHRGRDSGCNRPGCGISPLGGGCH